MTLVAIAVRGLKVRVFLLIESVTLVIIGTAEIVEWEAVIITRRGCSGDCALLVASIIP